MKTLNNDWETVEFEALTPEQLIAQRANNSNVIGGTDPYNSGIRRRPRFAEKLAEISVDTAETIEVTFP